MNKTELIDVLIKEQFHPRSYSLIDERKDEALCLRFEDHQWCVYYSERGLQTGKMYFDNEHFACEFFLNKMRCDPTTKIGWKSGYSIATKKDAGSMK